MQQLDNVITVAFKIIWIINRNEKNQKTKSISDGNKVFTIVAHNVVAEPNPVEILSIL